MAFIRNIGKREGIEELELMSGMKGKKVLNERTLAVSEETVDQGTYLKML